ncbi:hypothetical protein VN12_16760 [Pirellula sp. SH-Sr6A]|uniref:glycoside hydrolase family 10 protein n=1 Tax=Pirellula sp. SH-Sr6A TaxID=1632865 RepID=UPI00078E176D|nr:family 10 glycosylhydrolase [Pirellula sp. SH-Sr6A]AMV33781.1 hypothetical protein VN12_16760 [Pirellula sp. SH-Sr6A]
MNSNSYRFLRWLYLLLSFAVLQNMAMPQSAGEGAKLPNLPKVEREYRGVWVATVANIDWPSKPGLSTQEQQREAIEILNKVAELRMNVVVLQVRTSCDALYESKLEPWSYFLTGKQGAAPDPYYDPLEFWIHEAHRRGLELHAWFNPFRAKNSGQTYADSSSHISQTKPQLVKRYGNDKTNYLWLDPGEAESREHSLAVFLDVLRRYDVDGIHIDDYFYPYPVDDIPFPDDPAWNAYQSAGGKLARDDWRRDSMNAFIKQLYGEIKKTKPHVKFGISPFGIWKPGYPESVAGFSQHDKLYADAKLWLNEGWCDYYTPQLYWSITAKQQSFPALLAWWSQENLQNRHLAPGLYTGRIGDKGRPYSPEQIENQVFLSRYMPGSHGAIHFSMKALMGNREGISDRLRENAYSNVALTPECKWIDGQTLEAPMVQIESHPSDGYQVTWKTSNPDAVRQWCVYVLYQSAWRTTIVGGATRDYHVDGEAGKEPRAIAIAAINGAGFMGTPKIVSLPEN